MFNNYSVPAVSFHSNWKTEQELASNGCQTEDLKTAEGECQVVELIEIGTQTEDEEQVNYKQPEYNEVSLLAFLKHVTPKVIKELDKQNRSRAFESYCMLEDEATSGVKLLHTLRWTQLNPDAIVTSIDWSCTGSIVGVAYGAGFHDDWCDHKGAVAVWNINRNDFNANAPERVIEVSSCVLSLAFHPANPAVFAAGTFSGEVLVYDLSQTEQVTPIVMGDCLGSSLTMLTWVHSDPIHRSTHSLAASTSLGHVFVWGLQITKQQLTLKLGFVLQGQDLPRGVRPRGDDTKGVGISALSFNHVDDTLFVLGAEGGGVFLCSTFSVVPSDISFGGIEFSRCTASSLSPHTGRVITAECSPHHRNALLTAGSDNQIRLYSLLQPNKAVSTIYCEESIQCCSWSPSRPLVVASGKVSGEVAFYDFGAKSLKPFLVLPAAEKTSPISMLRFNKQNLSLICTGDQLGRVNVWQLPMEAVSPQPTELSALNSILDTLID